MLGRLRMTIPECMAEYRFLSTEILGGNQYMHSQEKLLKVAKIIILQRRTGRTIPEDYLQLPTREPVDPLQT